jgi:hypothetical protein
MIAKQIRGGTIRKLPEVLQADYVRDTVAGYKNFYHFRKFIECG